MEETAAATDHGVEEADVWSNFDKSVAYMKEVASLYESAFGCNADGSPSTSRKTVTKAHLDEAHNQAQQALELLASNLLNVSMTIVHSLEKQESEADRLKQKVSSIRQNIQDQQAMDDQEAIHKLFSLQKASQIRPTPPATLTLTASPCENEQPQHQLKLSLAPGQCIQ